MEHHFYLLREKFTIRDIANNSEPSVALGNRLVIPVGDSVAPLVIRCQSMHLALRYAAVLMKQLAYYEKAKDFFSEADFEGLWLKVMDDFEEKHNDHAWVCLYHRGKSVYHSGELHVFMDVVEQCEFQKKNSEDSAIILAQDAFEHMGKRVMIDHESHTGFVLDISREGDLRFAIMLRTPGNRSNFIARLSVLRNGKDHPSKIDVMLMAADYIEAINASVCLGFLEKQYEETKDSELAQKTDFLEKRLQYLKGSIAKVEDKYAIFYRPDKPDFEEIKEKSRYS